MKRIRPNVVDIAVTYNNEGNEIIMSEMSPEMINLFFGLINCCKRSGERKISISYEDLLSLCGTTDKKEARVIDKITSNFLSKELNQLSQITYDEKIGYSRGTGYPIFNKIEVDKKDEVIKFEFSGNNAIKEFIEKKGSSLTKFNLFEMMLLQSVHSKTLFRLLAQSSSTGRVKIDYNKFKLLFNKEDLSASRFNNEVVKLAVDEINNSDVMIKNLTYTFVKAKREIKMIYFNFDKCKYNDYLVDDRRINFYEDQINECAKELSNNIDESIKYIEEILFNLDPFDFEGMMYTGEISFKGKINYCLLLQNDGSIYTKKIEELKKVE